MPLPIARPDAVAVPTLARVVITGECIRIMRDGNGAFVAARIVEVLREEALDEPTRHEWFRRPILFGFWCWWALANLARRGHRRGRVCV